MLHCRTSAPQSAGSRRRVVVWAGVRVSLAPIGETCGITLRSVLHDICMLTVQPVSQRRPDPSSLGVDLFVEEKARAKEGSLARVVQTTGEPAWHANDYRPWRQGARSASRPPGMPRWAQPLAGHRDTMLLSALTAWSSWACARHSDPRICRRCGLKAFQDSGPDSRFSGAG